MSEEPVTWKDRAEMAVLASGEMAVQVTTAAVAFGLFGAYLGLKIIATPVNVVEAVIRPRHWTPPWRIL